MIFNLIKHAKQLLFDDTKAKTGSGNVQGAIESVKSDVDESKDSIDYLKDEAICCEVGDSYMGVDDGKIVKFTVDEIAGRLHRKSTKFVVQSHDAVLEAMKALFTPVRLKTIPYTTLSESLTSAVLVDNVPWNDYEYLIISTGQFSNMASNYIIPVDDYFAKTDSSSRPMICFSTASNNFFRVDVYKNNNNSIYIKSSAVAENQNVYIWGAIKK